MHRPSVAIRGPLMDGTGTAYQRAIMRNQKAARAICGHPWPSDGWKLHGLPTCHHVERGTRKQHGPSMDGAVDLGTYQRATMSRGGGTRKRHGPSVASSHRPSVASSVDGAVDTGHLPIFIARLQDWDGENFRTYSELLGISSDYFKMHGPSVASSMDGAVDLETYQRAIMPK